MISDNVSERLRKEPDFVWAPRHDNSLRKLLERYPDGVPDKVIAQVLLLEGEAEVEEIYQKIVRKLRRVMGVTD